LCTTVNDVDDDIDDDVDDVGFVDANDDND